METSNKNIALYIRLSSADKKTRNTKDESNSIIGQRLFLNNYLDSHNELNYYNRIEYVDDGFSGTNDNRPMFQQMIEDVKSGNIKAICVRDCSRFFRNYTEAGNYIECLFPFLRVRFISVNDNYDSNDYKGTAGSFELAIINIVYASYSIDLSEKTKSAKYHMINQGKYVGSIPPYGYMMHSTEKHKIVIDPIASKVVKKIFKYAIDGVKIFKIADILNEENIDSPAKHFANIYIGNKKYLNKITKWRYDAIHKILNNEFYIGTMVCLKRGKENIYTKNIAKEPVKILNAHKPIISEFEFEKANHIINKKKKNKIDFKNDNVLKGLVYCGKCKKLMHRRTNLNVFQCSQPKENNCYCEGLNRKRKLHISETKLIGKILDEIEKNNSNLKELNNDLFYSINKNKQNKYNNQLKILNESKVKLYEQYINGDFSKEVYLDKRKLVDKSIDKLYNERDATENEIKIVSETIETAENVEISEIFTYEIAKRYIEKIYVYDKDVVEIIMKKC